MSDISSDNILSVSSDKSTLDGGGILGMIPGGQYAELFLLICSLTACLMCVTIIFIIHYKTNC